MAAWPAIRQVCPNARLAIVGDGDLGEQLRGKADSHVQFTGAVADVRPWLAAADVVVVPSRWEGLPFTALEALATGRSIVASDVTGLAEVVTPAVGELVPPEHTAALAEALARRLCHPTLTLTEGAAASVRARRFDVRDTLDGLATATEAAAVRKVEI